ncbi:MAG: LPS export ABC transporter periplasmic protein LptC [Bryobacteraceae bacterium]|nr:LPS export ABC transporter periplasmic protein LptC [Bryobacteraceae bacterium]
MWRARQLILLAILVIVLAVVAVYYLQKAVLARRAPQRPTPIASNLNASAEDWVWSKTEDGRPVVEVRARTFEQVREPAVFNLEGVELRLYEKDGKTYDLVKSARAQFDQSQNVLFSEGEVEITMGIPVEDQTNGRLLVIRSSGVRFDTKTGKAETERPAAFVFDRGEGQSVGASYDPGSRELWMRGHVQLFWHSDGPGNKEMKVEAGELVYKEAESKVYLSPWSRLTRGEMLLEAANSMVTLENGAIRMVDAQDARGHDKYPSRQIEYAASQLHMDFADDMRIAKISGSGFTRLVSRTSGAATTVTSERLDLLFDPAGEESILTAAHANGKAVATSQPVPRPNVPTPDTRILRAEAIELTMRPGGQEMEKLATHTPGTIEFVPNREGQPRRNMDADRMTIHYGPDNQVQSFRAVNVATRTERPQRKPAPKQSAMSPALTWSKDLAAEFDPATSQIKKLEQWGDFRYQEGAQQATANHAALAYPDNIIVLSGAARVWDPSGSTSGAKILLNQQTNDFAAEGNVSSTRLPEKKRAESAVLAANDTMQAKAERMSSAKNNQTIVYEGKAVLWQGANRLEADRIEIDRESDRLLARGNVVSRFVDQSGDKSGNGKHTAPPVPVFTLVQASEMAYSDKEKLAHYTGGVTLRRPNMEVKAGEIRAFLKEEKGGGSSLDYALADKNVRIFQQAPGRTRTGTGEHAEYYVDEGKVILEGGTPLLVDSIRGSTTGEKLIYFSGDDRLLVNGAERQPVKSILRRK